MFVVSTPKIRNIHIRNLSFNILQLRLDLLIASPLVMLGETVSRSSSPGLPASPPSWLEWLLLLSLWEELVPLKLLELLLLTPPSLINGQFLPTPSPPPQPDLMNGLLSQVW